MIWIDFAFGPRYMGLSIGKNDFFFELRYRLQFNLFFLGHNLGRGLGSNLAWLNGARGS